MRVYRDCFAETGKSPHWFTAKAIKSAQRRNKSGMVWIESLSLQNMKFRKFVDIAVHVNVTERGMAEFLVIIEGDGLLCEFKGLVEQLGGRFVVSYPLDTHWSVMCVAR